MKPLVRALRVRWLRLVRRGGEAGSGGGMTLVALSAAVALLIVVGVVVDGGAQAQALDHAGQIASEAARTGAQAISDDGGALNERVAQSAVAQYLSAAGVAGTSHLVGNRVMVAVSITEPTIFLPIVGVDSFTVTGNGFAEVIYRPGSAG